jgi:ferrous iron transport protein B
MAEMRYLYIEKVCANTVVRSRESREHTRSVKIDSSDNKYLAIPVFLSSSCSPSSGCLQRHRPWLSDMLSLRITALTDLVDGGLAAYGINPVRAQVSSSTRFRRRGSVLSFLPLIVTQFLSSRSWRIRGIWRVAYLWTS